MKPNVLIKAFNGGYKDEKFMEKKIKLLEDRERKLRKQKFFTPQLVDAKAASCGRSRRQRPLQERFGVDLPPKVVQYGERYF